jgi:hypothetical protein
MELCALIDSGSCVTVISAQAYNDLCSKFKLGPLQPVVFNCHTASSQPLEFSGFFYHKIRIHRFTWYINILVADNLPKSMILGSDFISKSGLLLDLRHKLLYFSFCPHDKVPLCHNSQHTHVACLPSAQNDSLDESQPPDLSYLPHDQADTIKSLILEFPEVFTYKLGLTNVLQYHIDLNDTTPVRLPPYKLSHPKMHIMRQHVQDMLDQGIIRPSVSQYSSPIFLVPKGQSDFRPVVDYRVLNSKITIESVPLPDLHSCFSWFLRARYFTSLDLNSAFHQIGLTEESKPVTAFATDWNLFEYCRVPFGLATGAQVLIRLLDNIFF